MNEKLTQIDDDALDQVSGGLGLSIGEGGVIGVNVTFAEIGGILSTLGSLLSSFGGLGLALSFGLTNSDTET